MQAARTIDRPKRELYVDYSMIFIVLFLLAFGLIMLYSTSSYEASIDYHDSAYYFKKQLGFTIFGIGVMAVVSRVPYRIYKKFAVFMYAFAAVMVLLVKTSLGKEVNGARRWLRFGPLGIQPAEVAKLCMIIVMASFIAAANRKIATTRGFWTTFLIPAPISIMVWQITENLSSAIIIYGITFLMLFVSTPGYRRFILIATGAVGLAAIIVFAIAKAGYNSELNFRFVRILAWLDPEAYVNDKGYQTLQALYAIGSGGIFGKGLGESMQKLGFIPEAQNDMIFSIICEELGLLGAIAVLFMFALLIWRMVIVANNAPDMYGALLVIGVIGHIALQVILNVAVVTNTIPNTGITLPFISYGGSATVFLLVEIGIVFNVARNIEL
ncbi:MULTISPECIES: FtsW/RodA/SpoVE family cell cycle protein [unclassified Butyrivibrio]|uniref:FtsW/RodA/SpoVE family cell cycle protein n=1 Tax=unclassified Butyrivibrio TaxID=2639466 RepID=UPI00041B0A9C|nr:MULTISPECIES: putative peptidoglycan glycosyltransferase FtsW [unclassified Butyrivibrio]